MIRERLNRARARMMGLVQSIVPGDPSPVPTHVLEEFEALLSVYQAEGVDVQEWRIPVPRSPRTSRQRRKGRHSDGPSMLLLKSRIAGFLGYTDAHLREFRGALPAIGFLPVVANEASSPSPRHAIAEDRVAEPDGREVRPRRGAAQCQESVVLENDTEVMWVMNSNKRSATMSAVQVRDQAHLEAILMNGLGWLYNSFYGKFHHVSCRTLRQRGSEASYKNFKFYFPVWGATSGSVAMDPCPICKPREGQPAE